MTTDTEKQNQSQDQNPNPDNGTNGNGPEKPEKTVPYERFQKVNDAKKAAEETLAGIVAELVEDIPEELRDIVPDLPPAAKITWIRNANKKGLFSTKAPESGPDSKRPGGKPTTDTTGMSPNELITLGLKG